MRTIFDHGSTDNSWSVNVQSLLTFCKIFFLLHLRKDFAFDREQLIAMTILQICLIPVQSKSSSHNDLDQLKLISTIAWLIERVLIMYFNKLLDGRNN